MEDFLDTTGGKANTTEKGPEYWCKFPVLVFEDHNHGLTNEHDPFWPMAENIPLSLWDGSEATPPGERRKRETIRRGGLISFEHLVVTSGDLYSAHAVCASSTSWGPDFVHLDERIFCDMDTHTTYSFCNSTLIADCYDFDVHVLVTEAQSVPRNYRKMEEWDGLGGTIVTHYPGSTLRARTAPAATSRAKGMANYESGCEYVVLGWLFFFLFHKAR